jgi:O-antigen biosynthesis protein
VGVVGALGREKGGEMLERIAALAEQRNLPLRFVMLGDTHRLGGPQSLYGDHLFVHGGYRREELPSLLRRYRVMLAAFPAIGPETFSLTLSEVWACGLPALVPDLGALAERVRDTGAGWILREWQSPEAWLESLDGSPSESGFVVRGIPSGTCCGGGGTHGTGHTGQYQA